MKKVLVVVAVLVAAAACGGAGGSSPASGTAQKQSVSRGGTDAGQPTKISGAPNDTTGGSAGPRTTVPAPEGPPRIRQAQLSVTGRSGTLDSQLAQGRN